MKADARLAGQSAYVLALDHAKERWSAYFWDGSHLEALEEPEFEPGIGTPVLRARRGDEPWLVTLVVDTNPLLYTVTRGAVSERDVDDLAALQQIAQLAAGTIVAGVQTFGVGEAAAAEAASEALAATRLAAGDRNRFNARVATAPPDERLRTMAVELEAMTTDRVLLEVAHLLRLAEIVEDIGRELAAEAAVVKPLADALNTANTLLANAATALDRDMRSALATVQRAEQDYLPELIAATDHGVTVATSLTTVQQARAQLDARGPACLGALAPAATLVELHLQPFPPVLDPRERSAVRRSYDEQRQELRGKLTSGKACTDQEIGPAVLDLLDWLWDDATGGTGRIDDLETGTATPDEVSLLRALLRDVAQYRILAAQRDQLLTKAAEALAKGADLTRAAARIRQLGVRQARAFEALGIDPATDAARCPLRAGVIEVDRIEPRTLTLDWDKVRKEEVKLVVDPALKDAIVAERSVELTSAYEVEKRPSVWEWSVDFGVIASDLVDRDFTAVDAPTAAGAAAPKDTPSTPATPKVIALKSEESRDGELAAFLTWTPFHSGRLVFGPQIGFSLSTDDPGAFLGVAFGYEKWFKLSAGWTTQRVTRLLGQAIGETVANADAIRTREVFRDDWYAALTINLGELPIFKPDDDE